MTNADILAKINEVEGRIEAAQRGVHDSQEWGDEWTSDFTSTGETYQAWIDSGFRELREMIQQAG